MGDYNFYGGSNIGWKEDDAFDSGSSRYQTFSHSIPVSAIGLATDARTANQIKTTTDKLNTGAKSVEVQLTMPDVAESIPNQHLDEINRLRKLTGVDLTLHGPLVEPTGIGRERWDPIQREQAERQIWSAVQRAHRVNPDGNIVVTLHTSNGLPEPETKVWTKEGEKIEKISVINERTGEFGALPAPKTDYLLKTPRSTNTELNDYNNRQWLGQMSQMTVEMSRANQAFGEAKSIKLPEDFKEIIKTDKEFKEVVDNQESSLKHFYDLYKKSPEDFRKYFKENYNPKFADLFQQHYENRIEEINHGEVYVRDAYNQLKEIYNQAYESLLNDKSKDSKVKKDLEKLERYGESLRKDIKPGDNPFKNYEGLNKIKERVEEGMEIINSLSNPPKFYKPIKEFAIDKASETFANVAFNSYKEFKDSAPVLSLENPPAGSGINRAEDMKELIEETRNKFVQKAMDKEGLSESEAKKQAEKLIGATWDVGHINMIRKYGYDTEQLKKQSEIIAPYVKNVHLSDNFGMEHTELPMGMGNVPMREHLQALQKGYEEQFKKVKQVVETGSWYQHFQTTPLAETLEAFGSPIYGMKMAPYWNQYKNTMGGYFAGLGYNPDIHHSIYGAGFSALPVELGGQIAGRNRLSGAPIE